METGDPVLQRGIERIAEDARRERLHVRGLEGLHVNQERARVELTEEQRAGRSTRPPNGRCWKQLAKLDENVDQATMRHANAVAAVQEAEQRLQQAPAADARVLADWIAVGERGDRPESTVYEAQRDRDAARLLAEGAALELDRVLERRLAHVEKHREKMLREARADVNAERDRLLEHAAQLPGLRETLLGARATLLWAASFPEQPESFGFQTATALGLREPVERTVGTKAQLQYTSLLAALEADANALAEAFSRDVRQRLGTAPEPTPLTEAMWASDERAKAWGKQELERARQLAEYGNVNALADEARDFRPDPPEYAAGLGGLDPRHNRRGWRLDKLSLEQPNDSIIALCMALEALENQPEPVEVIRWL